MDGTSLTRERARGWLWGVALWICAVCALGLLLFGYHHLDTVTSGGTEPWQKPFITEMTAALGAGFLFFGVRLLVRRLPLDDPHWPRRLPVYGIAYVVFAVTFTSTNWALRALIFPLVGMGSYDYGRMPMRYFMEAPMQAISFVVMVAALHGVARLRSARERELRTARLERTLADARLRNLQLQLQPHFLFNALNTVSATMYQNVKAADRMLERLGDLLRRSLGSEAQDEVPLAEELKTLEAYLAIMRARFGERLEVHVDVAPDTERARVPSLLLQPLVENAIRHGGIEREGRGRIVVRAARDGDSLVLEVSDDGPGTTRRLGSDNSGIGLSNTAERLRLLYGERQEFHAGNSEGGGFRVDVRLPLLLQGAAVP